MGSFVIAELGIYVSTSCLETMVHQNVAEKLILQCQLFVTNVEDIWKMDEKVAFVCLFISSFVCLFICLFISSFILFIYMFIRFLISLFIPSILFYFTLFYYIQSCLRIHFT